MCDEGSVQLLMASTYKCISKLKESLQREILYLCTFHTVHHIVFNHIRECSTASPRHSGGKSLHRSHTDGPALSGQTLEWASGGQCTACRADDHSGDCRGDTRE